MCKYFLFLVAFSVHLMAQTPDGTIRPITSPDQLHKETTVESAKKLSQARIILADYQLIRRDFPEVSNLSDEQIDEWLLDNTGYIARTQTVTNEVNTTIPLADQEIIVNRPPHYGRGLVFQMKSPEDEAAIGLMDGKGFGIQPRIQPEPVKFNGLATLGECLREFYFENLIRAILNDSATTQKTVGSYAVLDLGFDIVHEDGSTSRAGAYLRQAHKRNKLTSIKKTIATKLDRILRTYGIDLRLNPKDERINIQGTLDGDLVDFGHYTVNDELSQIDPTKQIPFEIWGYERLIVPNHKVGHFYSKHDRPWQWSHDLARDLASGKANRTHATLQFADLLQPVFRKLTNNRKKSSLCFKIIQQIFKL